LATGKWVSIESDPSISPVRTSIASIAPVGTDSPLSSRSTENFFSSSEPVIATRIEPMRNVRAVSGLSTAVPSSARAATGGEEATAAGGLDEERDENGGIDETKAASMGGMDPGCGAGADADEGGEDSVRSARGSGRGTCGPGVFDVFENISRLIRAAMINTPFAMRYVESEPTPAITAADRE
jgi:hypothetical protein